jgi:hypothetical protein
MTRRGAPKIRPGVKFMLYVMMELHRDRKEAGRPRASVRDACVRLEKHLRETRPSSRKDLGWETIRRHVKDFKRAGTNSNSGEQMTLAQNVIEAARLKRTLLGWEADVWSLVVSADVLEKKGYAASLDFDKGEIVWVAKPATANEESSLPN